MVSGKQLFGVLLLILGAFALLGLLGALLGGLIPLIIGILLVVYGLKKWNEDRRLLGGSSILIGALFLIGGLPIAVSFLIGAVFIYFGWKMVQRTETDPDGHHPSSTTVEQGHDDPFDDEWERLMKAVK